MNAQAVLEQAEKLGIELRAEGDRIRYRPKSVASVDFVEALRQHKAEIMAHLTRRQKAPEPQPASDLSRCRNSLTPHSAHEFSWECDPYSCYCYREFGYPRLCQGVPCRWVWPKGVPEAAGNG